MTAHPVALDRGVRVLGEGRLLLGGDPTRLLKLAPGAVGWRGRLAAGDPSIEPLARTLVHRGLAHPESAPLAAIPEGLVTVVIPVLDRSATLDRCLAALGRGAPVLVVDDGSLDPASVAAVATRHGAVVLRLPRNRGPAAARNAGFAATSSDIVAFLDSDCRPPMGWLRALLPHLEDSDVAAVAPRIRSEPGLSLIGRYAAVRCPLDLGAYSAAVRPGGRVPFVPTAALVLRRSCVGDDPFDEELRYGEDVDLVWRLCNRGLSMRYGPRTVVVHVEPVGWTAWLARRHAYGTSAGPLSARHGSHVAPLVLSPIAASAWVLAMAGHPACRSFSWLCRHSVCDAGSRGPACRA